MRISLISSSAQKETRQGQGGADEAGPLQPVGIRGGGGVSVPFPIAVTSRTTVMCCRVKRK